MSVLTAPIPKTYLQEACGCLGVCRHCFDLTTPTQSCHHQLAELVLSLEVTILLLKENRSGAFERLQHCAELCQTVVSKYTGCALTCCRMSVAACGEFLVFWEEGAVAEF